MSGIKDFRLEKKIGLIYTVKRNGKTILSPPFSQADSWTDKHSLLWTRSPRSIWAAQRSPCWMAWAPWLGHRTQGRLGVELCRATNTGGVSAESNIHRLKTDIQRTQLLTSLLLSVLSPGLYEESVPLSCREGERYCQLSLVLSDH